MAWHGAVEYGYHIRMSCDNIYKKAAPNKWVAPTIHRQGAVRHLVLESCSSVVPGIACTRNYSQFLATCTLATILSLVGHL